MILFMDGVGHYGSSEIDKKYSVVTTGEGGTNVTTWTVEAEGRFGNAIKRVTTGQGFFQSGYLTFAPLMTQSGPWTPTASGVNGFAIKVANLGLISNPLGSYRENSLLTIFEGNGPVLHFCLNPSGTFTVYVVRRLLSGDGPVLLANSAQGIRENIFYFVEFKWVIALAGSVEIRVNGVPVLTFAGDTRATSYLHPHVDLWNACRWLNTGTATGTTITMWLCDHYLADLAGAGDEVRDFVGDMTIDYIVPDGVGSSTQWTPTPAVLNWENVDEIPPDCDGSYNEALTVGLRDSYSMQDVPAGTVPIAFQALAFMKKPTEGGASIQFGYQDGGAGPYYDSATQGIATVTECRYLIQPYDTNPATGATITEAEINAAEFGAEKVV